MTSTSWAGRAAIAQLDAAGGGKTDFVRQLEVVWPEPAAGEGARRPAAAAIPARAKRAGSTLQTGDAADFPRDFCGGAAELLDGALVTCEERFPVQGENSVLLVVVDREAERWREQLRPLEEKFLRGPSAAGREIGVKLEVMDRSTADLLRRLAESGVVNPSIRASRQLSPVPAADGAVPLTPAEQERARQARERHARKVKMARVLLGEAMIEEARAALLDAVLELGRALAIEHRQPEPASVRGAVAPPLDRFWAGNEGDLATVRAFLDNEGAALEPVLRILGQPPETEVRRAKDLFAGLKAKLAAVGT